MWRRKDVPALTGNGPRPWIIYLCWAWLILGGVLFIRQLLLAGH